MIRDNPSIEIASFVVNLDLDEIPRNIVDYAKLLLLDWLGCAIAGFDSEPVSAILDVALSESGGGECTVIPRGHSAGCLMACFVNAASSHVVELDDLHRTSILHPGTVVFPASLASSEICNVSGKVFLEGVIAGYEVAIRVGNAMGSSHYALWHSTATCGTFGSAVASGKILKLNLEEMVNSIGSAGTQAAGLWEFLKDGAMSKQLHTGKAAMNGLLSSLLAKRGFTGARNILNGEKGFGRAMSGEFELDKLTSGLGHVYETGSVSIKYYASCRHTHASIDAIREIMTRDEIDVNAIKEVDVYVYSDAYKLLKDVRPDSPYSAKFSIPFCVAAASEFGNVGVDVFTEQTVKSNVIRDLMSKVRIFEDDGLSEEYPEKWGSRVVVKTDDGGEFSRTVLHPKGDPENPVTRDEVIEKFNSLAGKWISSGGRKKIVDLILNFENVKSTQDVFYEMRNIIKSEWVC